MSPRPYGPQAAGYRYRRGCFQINLALSARPHFRDGRLDAGGALNLGRGVDALVTSVRQAGDGLLPKHPSISWHEPTAVDPTRAPAGRAVVRLQVLDVPHTPRGDAAGTRYGTHGWDPATAEAFADRVLAEAELHAPGLAGLVLERHLTTPADLAKASPNAGPGDHLAGDNSLVQAFTQRPIPAPRRRPPGRRAGRVADRRRDLARPRRQRRLRASGRPSADRRQDRVTGQRKGRRLSDADAR